MTTLLEEAFERVQALPLEAQDDIARMVLTYAGDEQPPLDLSGEEEDAVMLSRAAAARGEFATDEQVRAIWAKHGP